MAWFASSTYESALLPTYDGYDWDVYSLLPFTKCAFGWRARWNGTVPCLVYCLVGRMERFCFRVWLNGLNQISDQLIPLTMGPTRHTNMPFFPISKFFSNTDSSHQRPSDPSRPLSLGTSPRAPIHHCCLVRRRMRGYRQRCCRSPCGRVCRRTSHAAATSERERARWERETVRNAVKKGRTHSAFLRQRAEPESL